MNAHLINGADHKVVQLNRPGEHIMFCNNKDFELIYFLSNCDKCNNIIRTQINVGLNYNIGSM